MMNSLSATGFLPNYTRIHCTKRRRSCSTMPVAFSSLKSSIPSVGLDELSVDDVLQTFFKERKLDGDIIARISDELWLRSANANSINFEEVSDNQNFNAQQPLEEESEGGFLKLKRTSEWLMGDIDSAPMNRKMTLKEVADDSEKRKRLNLLQYEALKRELFLLTVAIGTACSGYCLVTLSFQAAISYATGVLFRGQRYLLKAAVYDQGCLYFQLLCKHADNITREMVPDIFRKKRSQKIGIRSEDLQDSLEKTLKGTALALSSPRLVMPALIYGLWELSQHFTHDFFDFQLVPAMVGLFAYKAAALVQVYRDNEDLQLIFPDGS